MSEYRNPLRIEEHVGSLGATLIVLRRPADAIMAHAWVLMDQEDLLDIVWHNRKVSPGEVIIGANRPDNTVYYACLIQKEGQRPQLAGLGWACDLLELQPGKLTGGCGMVFFRDFQHPSITREFCNMMLEDGFSNLGIQSLYGYAPINNRAACLFHRAMGFRVLATLPSYSTWGGEICDVQMSVMTADDWDQNARSRFSILSEITAEV